MTGTRFKPYPETKDSRREWLGEVPVHWEAQRLKSMAEVRLSNVDKKSEEGQESVRLCNYVDVYKNEYITPDMDFMSATATLEQIRRFALCTNDVLITKDSESWDDIAVPACVVEDMPGVLSGYHLALIRPITTRSVGRYLARAIASIGLREQFWVSAHGITRYGLTGDSISTATLPVPSVDEQQAIAGFLDRETAKIDALVEKKQRLIELLQEKRTALITHAVTKGLDPDVPMKDSGIEWLGQVPAHWEVPPLYARYFVELGKMLDSKRITGEALLPYLRNVDVQWDYVSFDDLPEMDVLPHELDRYTLRYGDLLVCEGGEVGRTAIWRDELPTCSYQKAVHRLRPRGKNDRPRFLFYVMRSVASLGVFLAQRNPNTIPHLTGEQLRKYRLPFPPGAEQDVIVKHLDRETAKIDALIAKVGEAIERLKEYRTALISAAVTGKIDVREEVESDRP